MLSHSDNGLPYGFRIVGRTSSDRRLIDWPLAFAAYCDCDDRADVDNEAYLSAFCFGDDFVGLLTATGSTRGYTGECWSAWLWFDIDRDELDTATDDARRLAGTLVERYDITGDELLIFFSGRRGFHVGLPTSLWQPSPSTRFHDCCRRLAESVAAVASVAIDSGVYDRVRAFRAPNSRHPKTGLHKRWLTLDALYMLPPSRVVELAAEPMPFELPTPPPANSQAVRDWQSAVAAAGNQHAVAMTRRTNGTPAILLNRSTMGFIREGATTGDRHRLLFSAAANLSEFGCPFPLAWALLSDSALDSGLTPNGTHFGFSKGCFSFDSALDFAFSFT